MGLTRKEQLKRAEYLDKFKKGKELLCIELRGLGVKGFFTNVKICEQTVDFYFPSCNLIVRLQNKTQDNEPLIQAGYKVKTYNVMALDSSRKGVAKNIQALIKDLAP